MPHSNSTASASTTVMFYDWERGANLIQITPDDPNKEILWDLELDSKTSYYFTPTTKECRNQTFPVGILRPDWLNGSEPIGESTGWDGRTVCGWTKGPEFINYYEDKHTREPNSWYFYDMKADFNVLYFGAEVGIPHPEWFQPPSYCLGLRSSKSEEKGQARPSRISLRLKDYANVQSK